MAPKSEYSKVSQKLLKFYTREKLFLQFDHCTETQTLELNYLLQEAQN